MEGSGDEEDEKQLNEKEDDDEMEVEESSDDESIKSTDTSKKDVFSDNPSNKKLVVQKRMVTVLESIEKYLEDAEEEKHLDLLGGYEWKIAFFGMLEQIFTEHNLNMSDVLTDKELMFTKLILTTDDLPTVCRAIDDNIEITKSILKKLKQCDKQFEKQSENQSETQWNSADKDYCYLCNLPFSNTYALDQHFARLHCDHNGRFEPNIPPPSKLDTISLENPVQSENDEEDEEAREEESSEDSSDRDSDSDYTNQYSRGRKKVYTKRGYSNTITKRYVTKISKKPNLIRSIFNRIIEGEISLKQNRMEKLKLHRNFIRKIAKSSNVENKRVLRKEARKHFQTGGSILGSVLKVIAPILSTLFN